jgi:hypothetical protein
VRSLNLPESFFDFSGSVCYCEACCDEREEPDYVEGGEPSCRRVVPKGWVKVPLASGQILARGVGAVEKWHLCYHVRGLASRGLASRGLASRGLASRGLASRGCGASTSQRGVCATARHLLTGHRCNGVAGHLTVQRPVQARRRCSRRLSNRRTRVVCDCAPRSVRACECAFLSLAVPCVDPCRTHPAHTHAQKSSHW